MNQETLDQVRKTYKCEKRKGKTSWESMRIALESVPGTYGMVGIQMRYSLTVVYYANTGETYDTTVLAWHNARTRRTVFKLGSWGDLVESGRYVS